MAFKDVFSRLEKTFPDRAEVDFLSTGSPVWDYLMGGGLPRGRIVEMSSEAGVGKSTTALSFMKYLCEQKKNGVYVDFENAMISTLQVGVGILPFKGVHYAPHTAKTWPDCEKLMDMYLKKEAEVDLIVIDSISSILPTKLTDEASSVEDANPGLDARIQAGFFKKYKATIANTGVCVIIINQARVKIDMRNPANCRLEGAGGHALKHYSDLRFFMRKMAPIYEGEGDDKQEVGATVGVVSVKNKIAGLRRGQFNVIYGKGLDAKGSLVEMFKDTPGCESAGSFFKINCKTMILNVKGNIGLKQFVEENEALVREYLKELGKL